MAGGIEFHHVRFGAGRVMANNPARGQNGARLEDRGGTDTRIPCRKRPDDFAIHLQKSPQSKWCATATLTPIASVAGSEIRRRVWTKVSRTSVTPIVYLSYILELQVLTVYN